MSWRFGQWFLAAGAAGGLAWQRPELRAISDNMAMQPENIPRKGKPQTGSQPAQGNTVMSALSGLGFSDVEALVYFALLRFPGVTAYRLSKLVGKSQANVSLALTGLVKKHAVVINAETPTTYDPVPVQLLLKKLKQDFTSRLESATTALESVDVATQTDRIRRLGTTDEVYVQAQAMLENACETVAFLMSSGPVARLRDELVGAAARASVVGMLVADECDLPGVRLIRSPRSRKLQGFIEGEMMILLTDAREMLLCFFEPGADGPRQAIWANHPLLVGIMHNAITGDLILHNSGLLAKVGSPNEYLYGLMPTAILETFRGTGSRRAID